jgi:hypothetical protein
MATRMVINEVKTDVVLFYSYNKYYEDSKFGKMKLLSGFYA